MAYMGRNNELYDASVDFLEHLIKKSKEEKKSGKATFDHLYHHKINPKKYKIYLNNTKKLHDSKLINEGQFGRQRRCRQYPFDPSLKKKNQFKDPNNATIVKTRELVKSYVQIKIANKYSDEFHISTQLQVDKLCKGEQLLVR